MKRLMTSALVIAAVGLTHAGCALFGGGGAGDENGGENGGASAGAMDATQYVQAPATLALGPNVEAGWTVTQSLDSGGQQGELYYAIVADGGDVWHVECRNEGLAFMSASMPDLKDMLIGLVVNKEDGTVTKAVLGKPGEAGKEIKIAAPMGGAAGQDGVNEDVTIGLGTFPAKKFASDSQTMWMGNGGELDGVLLKLEPAQGDAYELSEMPSTASADVGGTSVSTTQYAYSNGQITWTTDNAVVAALLPAGEGQGRFKQEGDYAYAVTAVGTDGAAQLKWE